MVEICNSLIREPETAKIIYSIINNNPLDMTNIHTQCFMFF